MPSASIRSRRGRSYIWAWKTPGGALKSRINRILSASRAAVPPHLHLAAFGEWQRQDKGGLADLHEWLLAHKGTRLVVIDTWAKFRPAKIRGRDSYEEDYEHGSEIKSLADRHDTAILSLHHCSKRETSDPVESISGTLGLSGCADGLLVLKRERGQHDAALYITGRDVDEQELALTWDPEYCVWSVAGQADEYRMSKDRAEVIEVLRKEGRPMAPSELAPLLGKSVNAVKQLLWRMAREDWLKRDGRGGYSCH